MRSALAARLALPATILVTGAALLAPSALAGSAKKVQVTSNAYTPGKQIIRKGDKVRFVFHGGLDVHDVNVSKGPEHFESPLKATGTWTHRFKKAGKYVLYCSQHEDMTMKLVVRKR